MRAAKLPNMALYLYAESMKAGTVTGSVKNGFIVSCARIPKTEMAKIKIINILFMI